jgi:3-deoxy-D-arabino-heptulosonate 7-phosphate (DAHP) synthase
MMTQVNETRPDTAMEVIQDNAEVMIAQLATWAQIKSGTTEQATENLMLVVLAGMNVPAEA